MSAIGDVSRGERLSETLTHNNDIEFLDSLAQWIYDTTGNVMVSQRLDIIATRLMDNKQTRKEALPHDSPN